MKNLNKPNSKFGLTTLLLVSAILAVSPATARSDKDVDYNPQADGGVEIKFNNGCRVTYNGNENRAGHRGSCKNKQFERADEYAASYFRDSGYNPGGGSSGEAVPEGQMSRYCRGEASSRLNTRPTNLETDEVLRDGHRYVVYGRTNDYSATFECHFNRYGEFNDVLVHHNSGGGSSSNAIPEGQMSKYCQGEAAGELNMRPNYLNTGNVQRDGNRYVVYGHTNDHGYSYECHFNRYREFNKVLLHRGSGGDTGAEEIPHASKQRCRDMFGEANSVSEVSALRPGYWEVIIQARNGRRSVACTVNDQAGIENWVELN